MKNAKLAIFLLSIGAAVVVYAHNTFITKDLFGLLYEDVKVMKADIKQILRNTGK